jgi:hypothetical protein
LASLGYRSHAGITITGAVYENVEERVRMAGIGVIDLTEVVNSLAAGAKVTAPADYLYVYVNAVRSPIYPVFAGSISIEVNRRLRLDGNKSLARGVTWKTTRLVMFGSSLVRDSLRDAVKNEMDQFITAYLLVNPR